MKIKSIKKVALLAVVAVALIAVLLYTDLLPGFQTGTINQESPPCSSCPQNTNNQQTIFDDNDIFDMLQYLSGKTLNYAQAQTYIDSLHMQAYGVNGKTHDQVINEYIGTYADLTYLGQQPRTTTGWTATLAAWLDGTEVKAVCAGSGASVTAVYNYDVMVLISNGDYATYQSFIAWLNG
jgi:hypothetical protein